MINNPHTNAHQIEKDVSFKKVFEFQLITISRIQLCRQLLSKLLTQINHR